MREGQREREIEGGKERQMEEKEGGVCRGRGYTLMRRAEAAARRGETPFDVTALMFACIHRHRHSHRHRHTTH